METWAPRFAHHIEARGHFNMTLDPSSQREWAQQNRTRALINRLQQQQVQTLRTTHVTIGVFSLVVALLTLHRIISDARRASRLQGPSRPNFFQSIHPAEIFPLVLACGAVLQQIIFVAVQATSLNKVLSDQCRGLAMITFPGIFLMGYITLVFGIEIAIRAFKPQRFAPRTKWNAVWCIGLVSFLLFLTWLPTIIWPMPQRCLGSLIFIPVRYSLIAVIILSILVLCFLVLAAMIGIQLMRTSDVDSNERIAASRMCYFLLLTALVYVLILPVEIQSFKRDFLNTNATSRIAEVSLFASGLLIGIFHLFLRANALRMVIQPSKDATSAEKSAHPKKKRPRIRFFGPSDLEMNISGPLGLRGGPRPDSRQGLIDVGPEKNHFDFEPGYFVRSDSKPLSPGSMKSLDLTKWPLPPDPPISPGQDTPGDNRHTRTKSSYSLFPTRAEDIPRLPATVYSPPKSGEPRRISKLALRRQKRRSSLGTDAGDENTTSDPFAFLSKPPPLFAGGRHGRFPSTDSSATVQIGLRFSVAPATLAAAKCANVNRGVGQLPAPPLRRDNSESSGTSLGLPIQAPSTETSSMSLSRDTSSVNLSTLDFPAPPQAGSPPNIQPLARAPTFPPPTATGKTLPPTPRSAKGGDVAHPLPGMSGLRMNPVSPQRVGVGSPTGAGQVTSPRSARIAVRSPPPSGGVPPNGWI